MTRRLPAEWEEQDGVLLAWPHDGTDWAGDLDSVEPALAGRIERKLHAAASSPLTGVVGRG